MTSQDIFNKVVGHLLAQNERAMRRHAGVHECAYRGNNETKCALGCLINDEYYSKDFEGQNLNGLKVRQALRKSIGTYSSKSVQLMRDLQGMHDHDAPHTWPTVLADIAKKYKLVMPS